VPRRPLSIETYTPEPRPLALAAGDRDGLLYVPRSAPAGAAPLLLLLHAASGSAKSIMKHVVDQADRKGVIVVAPDSRGPTWDVSSPAGLGADVAFIDNALAYAFAHFAIDPHRILVGGFSDGATYALTLGLTNGNLFNRVVAFSPGYLFLATTPAGKPRVFISHGTRDTILPIDRCGRAIAAHLRRGGYSVELREFDGPHTMPPEIVSAAFDWAV